MMKNKDNPVPSLDNIILVAARNWANNGASNKDKRKIISALNKLQNGVETNKEQPKYLVMYSNYPIAFCSNKKKFLKEEMFDDEERELTEFIPIKLGNID